MSCKVYYRQSEGDIMNRCHHVWQQFRDHMIEHSHFFENLSTAKLWIRSRKPRFRIPCPKIRKFNRHDRHSMLMRIVILLLWLLMLLLLLLISHHEVGNKEEGLDNWVEEGYPRGYSSPSSGSRRGWVSAKRHACVQNIYTHINPNVEGHQILEAMNNTASRKGMNIYFEN